MARSPKAMAKRTAEVNAEVAATAAVLGEMTWAAQNVVAMRMTRMAGVLADPSTASDPEFQTMVWEKLRAVSHAGFALAEGWRDVQDGWWGWSAKQMEVSGQAAVKLCFALTPEQMVRVQTQHAEASLDAAETACARMVLAATRLAGLGLGPLQKAATANHKRLRREAKLPALLG